MADTPPVNAGGNVASNPFAAQMEALNQQTQETFMQSAIQNAKQTQISTWGNMLENIAKNKPNV